MNVTKGPMLELFATVFSIPVNDVVAWVNTYVNHPEQTTNPEPTEQERLHSIKEYITMRLGNTSDGRIKSSIRQAKEDRGEAA